MGSVLPSLTHAQQQRETTGTSGDLVEFKLVQKRKAAHKSLKRWFKCDSTLAPLRAQGSVQPLSPEEGAGWGRTAALHPPGHAEGQFLNILTKARMARLPEQWKCRLLSYLFFRTDAGRPQAGTASLYTDSFITWQPAAPTKIYMKQRSLFIFAKLYFTFCIWLWFDSWSACRVVSRAEGLTRQMFNRGSSKR